MSIVGAQGVSMSELTGMGLDRLNAMAQGQQPSIAPSYLVLAAIEQLKKGKAGEQTPLPQGTVKDRLLASINQPPPMQAGIAQMAQPQQPAPPTQQMAGGGSVQRFNDGGTTGSFLGRSQGANLLPNTTGYEGMGVGEFLESLGGSAVKKAKAFKDWLESSDAAMKDAVRGTTTTKSTNPTARVGTEVGRGTNNNPNYGNESRREAPVAPNADVPSADTGGVAGSISASSRQRGVGGMGTSPLAKYATEIPATPSEASFQLNIPKNQQLADAAAKYSMVDAARMAELERAEERAGLGAFARGMVNPDRGRGFGAVFGSAAADYNDAREKRADARREYQDKREEMATKLQLAQGSEERDNFLKNSEWGAARAQEAWQRAARGVELGNQATHYENQDMLKAREIDARLQEIAVQAGMRKDNTLLQRITMISQQRVAAGEKARNAVFAKYKEMPTYGMDATMQRKAEFEAENAARNADAKYLVMLAPMLKQLGVPTE